MRIQKVDTNHRGDVNEFVQLPFRLYEGSEQWVPPLVFTVKQALDRDKHPFYRHSDAAFFLAWDRGEVVGRIAVLDNRHYNEYHNSKAAFFHYFDVIDDLEAAQALFGAADAWAKQRDLDTLIGPKGLLRSDGMGILVEGFEYRAVFGIPYNAPYYVRLVEAAGFEKEVDYVSGYIEGDYELPERILQIAERVKERRGYWGKSFTSKRELREWIPRVQRINNEAFTDVWGYYPLDDAETEMIGDQLLTIADPRMIRLVMKGDEVAGFAFVFPDVSEALQAINGRLWPFGWIRLLWAHRFTKRLSANGLGLLPKYQGVGSNAVLYASLFRILEEREVEFADVAQIAETNLKSMGDMTALGIQWYKRHRIYRRAISS